MGKNRITVKNTEEGIDENEMEKRIEIAVHKAIQKTLRSYNVVLVKWTVSARCRYCSKSTAFSMTEHSPGVYQNFITNELIEDNDNWYGNHTGGIKL